MATPSEHTPLGQLAERYWVESRRPLASLVFIAPLLIVYEVGILLLGARQNGADAFLRRLLELLGFGQHFLLPLLTVCILLGWHYLSREPWQLSGGIISTMTAESLMMGLCLRIIAFVHHGLVTLNIGEKLQDAVGFLGAGIYEELLFRLILFSLVAWAFRQAGKKGTVPICAQPGTDRRLVAGRSGKWGLSPFSSAGLSTILAVLVSSLLFAAAHHVGPYGENLDAARFLFRFVAGVFFAVLFVYRGFGIAAGSHAAYDVLVGVFG